MTCCGIPKHPKVIAGVILRTSFGLSLLFVGLAHYMAIDAFVLMVTDSIEPIAMLAKLWAYIYPALLIVGGALYAIGMYKDIATWAAGIALGSIPAGMLLKSVIGGAALSDMMPPAINAMIWLLVYCWVTKMSCCGSCCVNSGGMEKCK